MRVRCVCVCVQATSGGGILSCLYSFPLPVASTDAANGRVSGVSAACDSRRYMRQGSGPSLVLMSQDAGLVHRRLEIVSALPAWVSGSLLVTRKQSAPGCAGVLVRGKQPARGSAVGLVTSEAAAKGATLLLVTGKHPPRRSTVALVRGRPHACLYAGTQARTDARTRRASGGPCARETQCRP